MELNPRCTVKSRDGKDQCGNRCPPKKRKCTNCAKNKRKVLPNKPRKQAKRPHPNLYDKVPELLAENRNCGHCGKRINKNHDTEAGHYLPMGEGGKDDWSNLMAVHYDCNRAVAGKLPWAEDMEDALAGVKRFHKNGESRKRLLTIEQEKEVCRRHLAGENRVKLGKAFKVDVGTIGNVLDRNEVPCMSNKEANGGLDDETENEIYRRYWDKDNPESVPVLAKAYGRNTALIAKIVRRKGGTRTLSESHKLFYKNNRHHRRIDDDLEAEICRRYLAGEVQRPIAKALGVSQGTVQNTLARKGINPRTCWESRKITGR